MSNRALPRAGEQWWVSGWIASVLCLCIACDGSGAGSLARLGVDDGAPRAGLSKSAVVDGRSDVRIALDTGALVDVPAGAVTKNVKVTLERPADTKALKLLDSLKSADRIVSAPYVLTPHGTKFQEDVTVTLPIAKDGSRDLRVAWLEDEDDTEWKLLGVPKSNGEKASIDLRHFSVLVLIDGDDGLEPSDPSDDPPIVRDSGTTVGDAGGAELDAGPPGVDAAIALDGGVGPSLDAAGTVDPIGRDAAASSDAATRTDSGPGAPDAGPPPQSFLGRLDACGYVSKRGGFPEPVAHGPYEACFYSCVYSAPCSDLAALYCSDPDAGPPPISASLTACWDRCAPVFQCPEQTFALRCDGEQECSAGADELGCDPKLYFTCDGYRYPASVQCDGVHDCELGDDELGCSAHVCDRGGTTLPASAVCDGVLDCSDRSDEPQTCAVVTCPAI